MAKKGSGATLHHLLLVFSAIPKNTVCKIVNVEGALITFLLSWRRIAIFAIAALCCASNQAHSAGMIDIECPLDGVPGAVPKYRFDEQKKIAQNLSSTGPQYSITFGQIYPADITPEKFVIHVQLTNRAKGADIEILRATGSLELKIPNGRSLTSTCRISASGESFVGPQIVEDRSGAIAVVCRKIEVPSLQDPTATSQKVIDDDWNDGWILNLTSRRAFTFDPHKRDVAPKPSGDIVDVGNDFIRFCESNACDRSGTLLNRINGNLRVMTIIDGRGLFVGRDGFECKAVPNPDVQSSSK